MVKKELIKYFKTRDEWRKWLSKNFETAKEIWFVFPKKSSGKVSVSYNDAVEEALYFGWIDSTVKSWDSESKIQRFTPRKSKNQYSQPNRERLKWLLENGMIHAKLVPEVQQIVSEPFRFPKDIMDRLRADKVVWKNFSKFSEPYKRIRIGYIESARKRPEEFEKRLNNFITKTRENKLIPGSGGIEKYY